MNEDYETELGTKSIVELMNVVDSYIPQPERPVNAPFLMPVEESLSITVVVPYWPEKLKKYSEDRWWIRNNRY